MVNKWEDVNLDQFVELAKIEVDKELQETPLLRACKRILILSDHTQEELDDLSGSDFGHLIAEAKFTESEPEFEQPETFLIGDVEYGYRGHGELSTGEYISAELAIADARRKKASALPALLAILIRPVVKVTDKEFGDQIKVEKFSAKTHKARVAKFRKELKVPFFIAALTSITAGENGIRKAVANYMEADSTTQQGKK